MKISACTPVVLLLVFTILTSQFGCQKSPVESDDPEPPDIPPMSSFVMDFTPFESNLSKKSAPGYQPSSKAHWGWAALNVGFWNTFIMVGLAVPVAAFAESFNHEPKVQPDGSWVWSYQVNARNDTYTANLHARAIKQGIEWKMYVSKQGEYQDFNWYTGVSDMANTSGTWTVFKEPDEPVPCVEIVWDRDVKTKKANIRYTNVIPNDRENGGYIAYGVNDASPYNAFYDIYNKGKDNLTQIEMNRTSKDGRIKDPMHFGDGDWHCWDAQLNDTECN